MNLGTSLITQGATKKPGTIHISREYYNHFYTYNWMDTVIVATFTPISEAVDSIRWSIMIEAMNMEDIISDYIRG